MDDEAIALGNFMPPATSGGVGIFLWDLVADSFRGDAEVARVFAMDEADLKTGITIERLLSSLHPVDRERVAKSLHTAIVEGSLCRETFRIHLFKDRYRDVLGVLRCFGEKDDLPTSCTGFVCEVNYTEALASPASQDHSNIVPFKPR